MVLYSGKLICAKDQQVTLIYFHFLSLVFICRENPRQLGILLFVDHPDFANISDINQRFVPDFYDYEFGGKWKVHQKSKLDYKCASISAIQGIGNERNPSLTDTDVPDSTNLSFYLSGMIANHCRHLGCAGKIETLPILQICPLSSHPRRSGISTIQSFY